MQIHFRKARLHQMTDVLLRNPFLQRSKYRAKYIERRLASQAHQLKLMSRLVCAARDGDWISGYVLESRSRVAEVIVERKACRFLNANPARAYALFGQRSGGYFGRALIFLPNANFNREAQLLSQPAFLERRHD